MKAMEKLEHEQKETAEEEKKKAQGASVLAEVAVEANELEANGAEGAPLAGIAEPLDDSASKVDPAVLLRARHDFDEAITFVHEAPARAVGSLFLCPPRLACRGTQYITQGLEAMPPKKCPLLAKVTKKDVVVFCIGHDPLSSTLTKDAMSNTYPILKTFKWLTPVVPVPQTVQGSSQKYVEYIQAAVGPEADTDLISYERLFSMIDGPNAWPSSSCRALACEHVGTKKKD